MAKKQLFQKVGNTKIIPISFKIVAIFTVLLLLSNFATNFVNLVLSQRQIIRLNNEIMVGQLKDLYTTASNQYQIYQFNSDRNACIKAIERTGSRSFELENSLALAVTREGEYLFSVCADGTEFDEEFIKQAKISEMEAWEKTQEESDEQAHDSDKEHFSDYSFPDKDALAKMNADYELGLTDGSISFSNNNRTYFGVYKYQEDWGCYLIRAELRAETTKSAVIVFGLISIIILLLTGGFLWVGFVLFGKILANVKKITGSLYEMQQNQKLTTIDLSSSPNDDITYLAASFNELSSTIGTLLGIFQKFVSKDVVAKAYNEHEIRLEGKQRELTMLFSDIKSFTYRTETLGNDIIDLLNVHYDRVIHAVHENSGVIGSIIGDAILAIYGTDNKEEKSLCSLETAWQITRLTAELRKKMIVRRDEILKKRPLSEDEDRVFKAVLIEVGVGIDGGNVFYGNIGSNEHMTNTVIGDNVNSASRLEGLTRIYHLPVIVSGYIRDEVLKLTDKYTFYEIDTVQVKGKTEGKKIYYPLDTTDMEEGIEEKLAIFEEGLAAYYEGDWSSARKSFAKCDLEVTQVFKERMGRSSAPSDWSGIWTMSTK